VVVTDILLDSRNSCDFGKYNYIYIYIIFLSSKSPAPMSPSTCENECLEISFSRKRRGVFQQTGRGKTIRYVLAFVKLNGINVNVTCSVQFLDSEDIVSINRSATHVNCGVQTDMSIDAESMLTQLS
jgi:hypothetical protein